MVSRTRRSPRARDDPKGDLFGILAHYGFELEYPFKGRSGKRRFRFDAAKPEIMLAVEYDGHGVGHQSISGTWADADKSNEAQMVGWMILRCNVATARSGYCIDIIEEAMKAREGGA